MEDFESRDLSPELLNISNNSRLQFLSPVASMYSDVSEDNRLSWSPPPWRKHSTGWYNQTSGLKSPPRSRESSAPLGEYEEEEEEDDDDDDDDDDENFDDEVIRTAARIALPESPLKGRSEERSLSPEVRTSAANNSAYMTPPASFETPPFNDARWNNAASNNNCE